MYPNSSIYPDDSLNTSLVKHEQGEETVFSLAEGEVEDAPGSFIARLTFNFTNY